MHVAKRTEFMQAGHLVPMSERTEYEKAWGIYRLRRNVALFLLFGFVPASVAGFVASRQYLHIPVLTLSLMFLWFGSMCLAIWYAGEFRCPRCRRRFGALGSRKGFLVIFRGLFDRICYNCKLRKFETG